MSSPPPASTWPVAPEVWRKYDAMEARLTAPVSERMLELGGLGPGMRVLDVGSGTGEPALRAARRVAPGGSVLGIDAAGGMLGLARERAAQEGLSNVEFRQADAQEFDAPAGQFDCATARWSLMYMPAPERALERIRTGLKPGGRLVAAFWAEPERVEYASLPRRVLARFCDVPGVEPERPGVFRYAEEEAIRRSLQRSGFTLERIEELRVPVVEFDKGEALVTWVLDFGGPMTRLVRELPAESQRAWAEALAREAEKHRDGVSIRIGGVTRLVLART